MIESIALKNFMAFEQIELDFSPKINVIIGENGLGKTQLLKAVYSTYHSPFTTATPVRVSSIQSAESKSQQADQLNISLTGDLVDLFLPLDRKLGKLHHKGAKGQAEVSAKIQNTYFSYSFYNNSQNVVLKNNTVHSLNTVAFIPAKEVLSFMEGFISVYTKYQLSFDKTYSDICLALDLPLLREGTLHEKSEWAIKKLEENYNGKFIFHGGGKVTFKTKDDEMSSNSVAEGFRKLGMLARLTENGMINFDTGAPLLWDEPEANLNPKMMKTLVEVLLELSRNGQQILLATHDYVLLKWFDLLANKKEVRFHRLYRDDKSKVIMGESSDDYSLIAKSAISDTFAKLYNEDLLRALGDV